MRNYFVKAPRSKEKHCVKHIILTKEVECLFAPWPFWFLRIQTNLLMLHFHHKDHRSHKSKHHNTPRMNILVRGEGGVGISFTTINHPHVYMYKYWNWNSKTLKLEIPECLNIISIWFTLSVLPFQIFRSIIFSKDSYFLHSWIRSAFFSQFQLL